MLMYTESFCRSIYRYRQITSCICSYMDLEAQVTHLPVLILRTELHHVQEPLSVPGPTLPSSHGYPCFLTI